MRIHINQLKGYQLIKKLYIYAYLYEIYKSYQKYIENEAIIASLAAKEKEKSLKKPEPKPKTASRDFFSLPHFSLGANHLKSKTAPRFFPLLHYNSRRGGRFLQGDPLGYQDSLNLYQGMNMNPANFVDPMGKELGSSKVGKGDLVSDVNLKTGNNFLDKWITPGINGIINTVGFAVNAASNTLGYVDDQAWNAADYGLSKVGVIDKRGDLKNDTQLKSLISAFLISNPRGLQKVAVKSKNIVKNVSGFISGIFKYKKKILPNSITFKGQVFRYNNPNYMKSAWETGVWNKKTSHRFSKIGEEALYASTDAMTAFKETRQSLLNWLTAKKINIKNIVDLTDPKIRKIFGVSYGDIASPDFYKITQKLGSDLRTMGYEGILAPSAQYKDGINLILFKN